MSAAQISGTGVRSLWHDPSGQGIAVEVIGQVRTTAATVELHDVVFHADAESDRPSRHALFDLSLTGRAGEPVGRFPELSCSPQRIGELLFIPPRTRFHGRWHRGSQRTLWVVPHDDAEWIGRDWRSVSLEDVLDIHNTELRQAMLRLARELAQPGFAAGLMIEALCVEVLVLLQRHLTARPAALDARALGPAQLRRIEQLIDRAGPVPALADLARACNVSERHFTRLFRMATGQSAARFIHGRRMERARDRLLHSRLPVKQIAWEAGFDSPAAFATAFRRRTGHSPRVFRQMARA